VAKCIALGATLCGLAGHFLRAAAHSTERAYDAVRLIQQQLRVTMFAVAATDLAALQRTTLTTH
jgi:isopentenyl-diphosphate delta-isomerase